jgi:hypothetical protein
MSLPCDCHMHDRQVCDRCQGVTGNEKDKVTTSPLPTDAKARKECPIASGVIDYFPDAIAAVAHVSWVGSQQHNPGAPLYWDRSKSTDESDALMRHFVERGTIDNDGLRHSAKVAWRALALLQKEIENE